MFQAFLGISQNIALLLPAYIPNINKVPNFNGFKCEFINGL